MERRRFLTGAVLAPLGVVAAPLVGDRVDSVIGAYTGLKGEESLLFEAEVAKPGNGDPGAPYRPEVMHAAGYFYPQGTARGLLQRALDRRFWETFDREVHASPFLSLFRIRGYTLAEYKALGLVCKQTDKVRARGAYAYYDGDVEMKVYGEWLERGVSEDLNEAADWLARRMVARIGHELGHAVTCARYKVRMIRKGLRKAVVTSDEGHVFTAASFERGLNGMCMPAWEEKGRPAWIHHVPNLPFGAAEVALDEEGKAGEYRILPGLNPVVSVYLHDEERPDHVPPGRVRVYSCHQGMAWTVLDR